MKKNIYVSSDDNGLTVVSCGNKTAKFMLGKRAAVKEFREMFELKKSDCKIVKVAHIAA